MSLRARIAVREPAAVGQVRVSLAVEPSLRALHVRAGQFVELFGDTPDRGYFALSNAPGEGEHLELLVRTDAPTGGEAAARTVALPIGAEIPTSAPLGAGFPLERATGRAVRVVATGTAIAPARAAIAVLVARGVPVRSLDYGVRTAGHVALQSELERFRRAGVEVAVHFSTPGEGAPIGVLAQDALAARWTDASAATEVVVAVGQPELVLDVRARWQTRGGDPDDVLTNT